MGVCFGSGSDSWLCVIFLTSFLSQILKTVSVHLKKNQKNKLRSNKG